MFLLLSLVSNSAVFLATFSSPTKPEKSITAERLSGNSRKVTIALFGLGKILKLYLIGIKKFMRH